ncbi:uncharacterized protein LOC144282257 isoform X1 [Canis aureus]
MCWEMGRNRQVIILTSISMGGVDILLKPSKTGTPAVDRRCHFIENEKSEVKYTILSTPKVYGKISGHQSENSKSYKADTEKASDMIKTFTRGLEGNYFTIIKAIHENPNVKIILKMKS